MTAAKRTRPSRSGNSFPVETRNLPERVRAITKRIGEGVAETVLRTEFARARFPEPGAASRQRRRRWLARQPRTGWAATWSELCRARAAARGLRALLAREAIQARPERRERTRRWRNVCRGLAAYGYHRFRGRKRTGRRPCNNSRHDAAFARVSNRGPSHGVTPDPIWVPKGTSLVRSDRYQAGHGHPVSPRSRMDPWPHTRGPTVAGELVQRFAVSLGVRPRPRRPDGSVGRVRAILGQGRRLLAGLARQATSRAVVELLAVAGCFDLSHRRLGEWAAVLVRAHGAAAPGILLIVLADVAGDGNVASVGAVLARRLPKMLGADWRAALSRGAADTVEGALRMPKKAKKRVNKSPLPLSQCYQAAQRWRAGESPEEIGKSWGFTGDQVRDAIRFAVRSRVVTESAGGDLYPNDVVDSVAGGRRPEPPVRPAE